MINFMNSFILKGDVCYSKSKDEIEFLKDGYLVCLNGKSEGVYPKFPERYMALPLLNFTGKLIIPGMIDLHIHAPQYSYRCLGMDLELMDWLNTYAFKEEAKFSDLSYAEKKYKVFVDNLKNSATTRACIFSTIHKDSTILLMDMLEKTGLQCYVGKVNMDRLAPDDLLEKNIYDTVNFIDETIEKYKNIKPIITPRFLPSCSDAMLEELKKLEESYKLPVQSHLSENLDEIKLVKELFPDTKFYGEGYEKYSLFGSVEKTIMAHCVYSSDDEIQLMKKNKVFVAHCPASNTNISSGIAPIRKYLDEGLNVGLASDVAGGETESIFKAIVYAIQASKLYYRLIDNTKKPLTFNEAFYLATMGGGKFFTNTGSFLKGYEFDCIVIDDSNELENELSLLDRLQRAIYLGYDRKVVAKYVAGKRINL